MIIRFRNMQNTNFLREPIEGPSCQAYLSAGVYEESDELTPHPFWAPFSWITAFLAGALFWYWVVSLLLEW